MAGSSPEIVNCRKTKLCNDNDASCAAAWWNDVDCARARENKNNNNNNKKVVENSNIEIPLDFQLLLADIISLPWHRQLQFSPDANAKLTMLHTPIWKSKSNIFNVKVKGGDANWHLAIAIDRSQWSLGYVQLNAVGFNCLPSGVSTTSF